MKKYYSLVVMLFVFTISLSAQNFNQKILSSTDFQKLNKKNSKIDLSIFNENIFKPYKGKTSATFNRSTGSSAMPITSVGIRQQTYHGWGGAYNPNTDEFWYPTFRTTTINVYDANNQLQRSFNSGTNDKFQMWFDKTSADDFYVANRLYDNYTRENSNGDIIWSYSLQNGLEQGYEAAGISTDENYAYLLGWYSNSITVVDKNNGQFIRRISLPGSIITYGCFVVANNKIYIAGRAYGWSTTNSFSTLHQLDINGNYESSVALPITPQAVAFDGEVIWISSNNNTSYGYQVSNGDAYGNGTTQDTTPPTITLNGDNPQTIELGNSYTELGASASDDTDGDITNNIVIDATDVNISSVGSYTVTYNISDAAGNTATTINRNVNVVDTTSPTVLAQDIAVNLDANGSVTITPQDINNGTADNSGNVNLALNIPNIIFGTANENGNVVLQAPNGAVINSIIFASYGTPTGSNGNYTISNCHAANSVSIVENYALGENTVTIPATNAVFGDPCGGVVKRLYITATYTSNNNNNNSNSLTFSCNDVGTNIVSLVATDAEGNTSSANVVVTVSDTINPEISITGDETVSHEAGTLYTDLGASVIDNCNAPLTVTNNVPNNTPVGVYTVVYSATDNSGNSVSKSRTVNISDTTLPVITLNGDVILILEENTNYTEFGASASDNLDGDITNNITIDSSSLDMTTPGNYIITYNVSDAAGNTATQVERNVKVLSSVPTTGNDTATVFENSNDNIIEVLNNDSFGFQGANATHPLTFANGALTNASSNGGAVRIGNNGTPNDLTDDVIIYSPATDFYGEDTITYVITDALGIAQTATVTITVTELATMSTPLAINDFATVDAGSNNNTINVLVNDSAGLDGFLDGGLTFTNGTLNSASTNGGLISINNNNTDDTSDDVVIYNTPFNFTGDDTFEYTITDSSGDASTATVTITINPIGNLSATDDTVFVEQDSSDNIVEVLTNDNFGANDRANTDYLTTSGTSTEGGTISVQGDQLLYTPAAGFNGNDSFTYTIKDGVNQTAQAIVNITVKAEDFINDIPTAEDDTATVIQNGTVNIDVLINDSFGNEGPTTKHMPLTTNKGWNTQITQQGGLITMIDNTDSNDPDHIPNLQPCFINYTPAPGFVGVDTFEYVITDASGDAATATVTVTVEEDETLVTTVADTASVDENSLNNNIDIYSNDVFGSRVLLRRLIINSLTTTQGGSLTIERNFSRNPLDHDVLYTPPANFTGEDTFTYSLESGTGTTSPVTVTITVAPVVPTNGTPTAKDDAVTLAANSTNVVIDVLSDNGNGVDDFGSDGAMNGGLTFTNGTLNSASTNDGLISVDNKGTEDTSDDVILYNAPANFTGIDTFQYTITDTSGDASTATVTITVGSLTEITTVNDTATTNVNTPVDIDYMANDIGINNTDGSFNIIITSFSFSTPVNGGTVNYIDGGILSINDDRLLYTPANNFIGEDSFTYTLTYGNGQTATGTVTVTVISTDTNNGIPTAVDDAITVDQDSTNNLLDVLDNDDYGLDGANATHPLTFTNGSIVNASLQGGAISIVDDNGTNKISYTPVPGFSGVDTITYLITDASGDAASASVTLTVTSNGTNATPTASDDSATVAINSASNAIDVLDNDTPGTDGYIDGGLTFTNGTLNSASLNGGAISIDNKGTLVTLDDEILYAAPKGFTGIDSFQYTITDTTGDASSATVTITVGAPNTITAFDDFATVDANSSNNTIEIFANDFGVRKQDGSPDVTIEQINYGNLNNGGSISQVDGGVLSFNDDHISYTPAANFSGTEIFTYELIYDNGSKSSTATVTITVKSGVEVNGTPTAQDDSFDVDRTSGSADAIVYLNVLDNDDFGTDGAMTAHNALNLVNGKIDEISAEGRRIRIDDNGTPTDYSDDRIAYYTTNNTSVTSDSFTYFITDNSGDATSAFVTINYIDLTPTKPGGNVTNDNNNDSSNSGSNSLINNEFTTYPNPSNGNLTTTIYSKESTTVTLSLYDVKGMELFRKQVSLKVGKNELQNNFTIKPGVVFLKIYNSEINFGIKKLIIK